MCIQQYQKWLTGKAGYLIALIGSTLALLTMYFIPYTLSINYFPLQFQKLSDLLWPAQFTTPNPVWVTGSLTYLLSMWGSLLLSLFIIFLPHKISRKTSWAKALTVIGGIGLFLSFVLLMDTNELFSWPLYNYEHDFNPFAILGGSNGIPTWLILLGETVILVGGILALPTQPDEEQKPGTLARKGGGYGFALLGAVMTVLSYFTLSEIFTPHQNVPPMGASILLFTNLPGEAIYLVDTLLWLPATFTALVTLVALSLLASQRGGRGKAWAVIIQVIGGISILNYGYCLFTTLQLLPGSGLTLGPALWVGLVGAVLIVLGGLVSLLSDKQQRAVAQGRSVL